MSKIQVTVPELPWQKEPEQSQGEKLGFRPDMISTLEQACMYDPTMGGHTTALEEIIDIIEELLCR